MALPFIGGELWNTELNQERLNDAMLARQQAQLQQGGQALASAMQQWRTNNIANSLMNQQSPPVAQPVLGPNGQTPNQLDAIRAQAFQNPAAFSQQYSTPGAAPGSTGYAMPFNPTAPASALPATGGVAQLQMQGQQNALGLRAGLIGAQTNAANARAGLYGMRTSQPAMNPHDPASIAQTAGTTYDTLAGLNAQKAGLENQLANLDPDTPPGALDDLNAPGGLQYELDRTNFQIAHLQAGARGQLNAISNPGSQPNYDDPLVELSVPQANGTTARLKVPASRAPNFGVTLPQQGPADPAGTSTLMGTPSVPTLQQRVNSAQADFNTVPPEAAAIAGATPGPAGGSPLGAGDAQGAQPPAMDVYGQARAAVAAGGDPNAIKAYLQQNGYDPTQL